MSKKAEQAEPEQKVDTEQEKREAEGFKESMERAKAEDKKADAKFVKSGKAYDQMPSVGRIVMYIENPSAKPVPALVQAVDGEGNVSRLIVFHNNHIEFVSDVPTKGEATPRHWHWPTIK